MCDTIHPELKRAGVFFKLFFRANRNMFRLFYWLVTRKLDRQLKGYQNQTYWIQRSRGEGDIRVRVYGPQQQSESLPVLLYFHGGGYAINSPEAAYVEIRNFLSACPCIVVAPCYTKSLDAPYPAAINDCEDTLDWLLSNSKRLALRTDKVIVGGHSAGGGLTLALMLRLRARGDVNVAFQMPIYPMIDHRSVTKSARDNRMPVWSTRHNKLAWKMYLGDLIGRDDVPEDAAPIQADNYLNLPPAMTYVGSLDPFLDETVNMVEAFKRDGVAVDFKVFDQCYHAFDLVVPAASPSIKAVEFMQKSFADAVERYTQPQP